MFKRALLLTFVSVVTISLSTLAMEEKNTKQRKVERQKIKKVENVYDSLKRLKGDPTKPYEFKPTLASDTLDRKGLRAVWHNALSTIMLGVGTLTKPYPATKFFLDVNQATAILKEYFTPIIRAELTPIIREKLIKEGKIKEQNAWYVNALGGTALFVGGWYLKGWWEARKTR